LTVGLVTVFLSLATGVSPPKVSRAVLIVPEDALYVDLTQTPPVFYTVENISLARISDAHRAELVKIANMTEEEKLQYLDKTLNEDRK